MFIEPQVHVKVQFSITGGCLLNYWCKENTSYVISHKHMFLGHRWMDLMFLDHMWMFIEPRVHGKCIICYIAQTRVFGSQVDGFDVFWITGGWIKC